MIISATGSITHAHKSRMLSKLKPPAQLCTWRKMAGLWSLQNLRSLLQISPFPTSNRLEAPLAEGLLSKPSKAYHNLFFSITSFLPPFIHKLFSKLSRMLNGLLVNQSWKLAGVSSKKPQPIKLERSGWLRKSQAFTEPTFGCQCQLHHYNLKLYRTAIACAFFLRVNVPAGGFICKGEKPATELSWKLPLEIKKEQKKPDTCNQTPVEQIFAPQN